MYAQGTSNDTHVPTETALHGQNIPIHAQTYTTSMNLSPKHSFISLPSDLTLSHHHHTFPKHRPLPSLDQTNLRDDLYTAEDYFPPSVVGDPDMPEPAARPARPKLKFAPEDDALLVMLKETKNLTWKQIAEFFPGRSSGTLQVRYCTKLKAKKSIGTKIMLDRLVQALEGYERDRWRIISSKVGNGFSAAACKDKVDELNGGLVERRDFGVGEGEKSLL